MLFTKKKSQFLCSGAVKSSIMSQDLDIFQETKISDFDDNSSVIFIICIPRKRVCFTQKKRHMCMWAHEGKNLLIKMIIIDVIHRNGGLVTYSC